MGRKHMYKAYTIDASNYKIENMTHKCSYYGVTSTHKGVEGGQGVTLQNEN